MALVQYSDSGSDEDPATDNRSVTATSPRPLKRQRTNRSKNIGDVSNAQANLPPLPSEFLDLYATNSRISVQDDPSLHGGRKRITPHVVGNWPTHIYLEWYPAAAELAILEDVISRSGQKLQNGLEIHSLLYSDLGAQLPLHISLSRPVALVTEVRQPFKELLKDAIRETDIRPFHVKTDGLGWVSNFEKTRWFLVLRVVKPRNNELNRLLAISNQSLAAFRQPPLYQKPGAPMDSRGKKRAGESQTQKSKDVPLGDYSDYFHISIAWSLTEPSVEDKERVGSTNLSKLKEVEVPFGSVKLKIGNSIHNLELPTRVLGEGGFFGL
ncbi:hypothetical protein AJ79_04112 [Helicocarpus griseus UAMH5409]|uniref:U6 snRNA phosphodiesterase n=1 Tax=Helicocarpus griseus UAMH5409 TaxID=1447875 RepID=A0A2B7XVG1_9EURO|nr:hypothetical protein AJ79_04112 [Helicocarpus griseus UAMH5409]